MEIQVKIKNLNKVRAALNKSPQVVSKHINKAIKKSIWDIHDKAKDLVPYDTGYLSSGITRGVKWSNLRAEIFPRVNYAYWVEVLPYRHKVGQSHYMQGAVDQTNQKVNQNFNEGLRDSLEDIARLAR